jgi:hypothetical protein
MAFESVIRGSREDLKKDRHRGVSAPETENALM